MAGETWTDTLTNYVLSPGADAQIPSLNIATVTGGLEIFWPTNEVLYRLLENTTLEPTGWVA